MEDKVKVISLVSGRVILTVPELRLRRVWEKKGAVKTIPLEQLEEAMYNPGVEAMFTEGALDILDGQTTSAMDFKKHLGLEPEEAERPVNIIILTDKEREEYLMSMAVSQFRQKIKELPRDQVREMANYAIEKEMNIGYDKNDILRQIAGIDVQSAIKLNRDDRATKEE